MQVLAFFTDAGVPKTGLVPTVRIRDISDNTLVITDSTSSEVGDGWYKYDFIVYDSDKEYAIRFDGGPTLSNTDRYTSGTNDSFADDIADAVFEALRPDGVAVVVRAEHLCMTMRGIKKPGANVVTSAVRGTFRSKIATRSEFLSLLGES